MNHYLISEKNLAEMRNRVYQTDLGLENLRWVYASSLVPEGARVFTKDQFWELADYFFDLGVNGHLDCQTEEDLRDRKINELFPSETPE